MRKNTLLLCIISFTIILTIFSGCIEPYVNDAETVVIKISPDGEKIWENIIPCSDIQQISPSINVHAVEMSGGGSFILMQYPNQSCKTISRTVILDDSGKLKKDVIVPLETTGIIDLIPREENIILAFSRDGLIYTFNSGGEIISETSVSEFEGVSVKSGYYFTSVTNAGDGDIILLGDDKNPDMYTSSKYLHSNTALKK